MASPFDNPEWWRRINAAQEAINKSLEPTRKLQQLGAKLPNERIAKLHQQLLGAQNKTAEILRRNLEAIEGPRRALEQNNRALDKWLKAYDVERVFREVAEAGRKFEQAWRQSLPVNWRELSFKEIRELIRLTQEEGVPLVWVPGAELSAEISKKKTREEAVAFLVHKRDQVLDDVDEVLSEVTDPDLTGWGDKVGKATAAYRDGHTETAQSMAAAVVTAGLEKGMRFKKLKRVRSAAHRLSPDQARLARFRHTLVTHLGSRCVQGDGYQLPGFNRGDSIHEVADSQYTPENSLTGIMVAAAILRESQELRDTENLGPESGSNGGDPAS